MKKIRTFSFGSASATKLDVPIKKKSVSVAFEWSYYGISSTDLEVRTTLYSIITTGKYCILLNSFHLDSHPHTQKLEPPCTIEKNTGKLYTSQTNFGNFYTAETNSSFRLHEQLPSLLVTQQNFCCKLNYFSKITDHIS